MKRQRARAAGAFFLPVSSAFIAAIVAVAALADQAGSIDPVSRSRACQANA
jgi:hypothetical protein